MYSNSIETKKTLNRTKLKEKVKKSTKNDELLLKTKKMEKKKGEILIHQIFLYVEKKLEIVIQLIADYLPTKWADILKNSYRYVINWTFYELDIFQCLFLVPKKRKKTGQRI